MTHDPLFNEAAAQWAYDLVMKMDADAIAPFATIVVAETLWEEIEKNRRTLTRHLNHVVSKRAARLEKALDRMVAKSGDDDEIELMREVIAKARLTPQDNGWIFDESDVRRDNAGRFTFKVTYNEEAKKPLPKAYTSRMKNVLDEDDSRMDGLSNAQKARFQQGYQQVADFLDAVQPREEDHVIYTMRDRGLNRLYRVPFQGTAIPPIKPENEEFVAMEVRPTNRPDMPAGIPANQVDLATFGLISALGGNSATAAHYGGRAAQIDTYLPSFANDWTGAGAGGEAEGGSNARLYGRMKTGSEYLSQFQTEGSPAWIATKFAQFVGERGPEAEKVVGPKARRTMYRYRGIEKKPDATIVAEYDKAVGRERLTRLTPEQHKELKTAQNYQLAAAKRREGRDLTKEERKQIISSVTARSLGIEETPTELSDRGLRVLIGQMKDRVPSQKYYDLQLKSGHTPPSEGLIVNKHGKIVTQAVGYGDDHYLPFNLKNLKGLNGGTYIRTRSVGGPTTEDIYTGLVAGAQQITVVSRSGVFTVTFDDSFRGTRRYNDKAARMVKRYGKILDAVQSEQAERQSIPREVKRQIRDEVNRTMGGFANSKEKADAIARKEREYKLFPQITTEERVEIENQAQAMERNGDHEGAKRYRRNASNALLESKAYTWKLNGDGYAAALESLYEQFPYYFKPPRYTTLDEFTEYAAERDRGYVKARHIRPEEALEGYYDATIAGRSKQGAKKGELENTGKTTADRVDYQNWAHNRNNENRVGAKEEPAKTEEAAGAAAAPGTPGAPRQMSEADKIAAEFDRRKRAQEAAEHALTLRKLLQTQVRYPDGSVGPRLPLADQGKYPEFFQTPEEEFTSNFVKYQPRVEEFIRNRRSLGQVWEPAEQVAITSYERSAKTTSGKKWDASKVAIRNEEPYDFSDFGAAFSPSANPAERESMMYDINGLTPYTGMKKNLRDFSSPAEFKTALTKLRDLRELSTRSAGVSDKSQVLEELSRRGLVPDVEPELAQSILGDAKNADPVIENVQKYWALWANQEKGIETGFSMPPATPPTPKGPSTPGAPKGPTTPPAKPEFKGPEPARPQPKPKPTGEKLTAEEREAVEDIPGPKVVKLPTELKGLARADTSGIDRARETEIIAQELKARQDIYGRWATKLGELARGAKIYGQEEKADDLAKLQMIFASAKDHPMSPENAKVKALRNAVARKHEDLYGDFAKLPDLPDAFDENNPNPNIGKRHVLGVLTPLPKISW